MTTHLRARAVQAGAFVALVGGIIAAAPSAALAADPQVGISSLSSGDIPSGGKTTMTYTIANRNVGNPNAAEPVTVVVSAEGMNCSGQCNFNDTINPGQSKSFTATLTAGNVEAGETRRVQVQINATIGEDSGSATRAITVRGPDKPKTVREVSGRVRDQEGNAVPGASVGLQDSAGRSFNANTGSDGRYSIKGSESNPIAVGRIVVGAVKQGYETATQTVQGGADKSLNVPLTIRLTAATTSPTPSPSATPSATPTEDVTDEASEAAPAEEETVEAAPDPKNASGEDEGNGSLLFILLGGLLVAAGVGAIVLVLMRRKNSDSDDPDLKGAGAAASPGRGFSGADETRVAAPMGGRASDATMIAPRSGSPSIADAPTMIHRTPVPDPVDEFPDPYGAPLPQNGAYNAPGGFGSTAAAGAAGAAGTYGTATQYGGAPVPAQGAGYDDADGDGYGAYDDRNGYDNQNGYGDQGGYAPAGGPQRYDEPTGMYRPDPNGFEDQGTYADQGGYRGDQGYDDGYGQGDDYAGPGRANGAYPAGGYQGGAYGQADDDQGGYGSWDGPGGMDSGNAYGPPAGGGTYGGGGGQSGGTYGGGAAGGGTYGAGGGQGGTYGGGGAAYGGGDQDGYADGYDQRGGGAYGGDGTYGGGGGGGQGGAYGGGGQGGGTYGGGGAQGGGTYGGGPYGGDQGQRGGPRQQPPEGTQPGQRRPIDWMDD